MRCSRFGDFALTTVRHTTRRADSSSSDDRAEALFEAELNANRYPHLSGTDGYRFIREAKLQLHTFGSLFTSRHMLKRTATAGLMQFFQQATGINAIIYCRLFFLFICGYY